MNISATSGPNSTKFYLKHHLGGGLIALGFGPGRIGTLVSMATNSSHIYFILAGNDEIHNISNEFEIRPDRTKDSGVSCP